MAQGLLFGISIPFIVVFLLMCWSAPLVTAQWIGVVICLILMWLTAGRLIYLIRVGPKGYARDLQVAANKYNERKRNGI